MKSKSIFKTPFFWIALMVTLGSVGTYISAANLKDFNIVFIGIVVQIIGLLLLLMIISSRNMKIEDLENRLQKEAVLATEEESKLAEKAEQERKEKLNQRIAALEKLISEYQGKDLEQFIVSILSKELDSVQSAFYTAINNEGKRLLKLTASFAYHVPDSQEVVFEFGEGLCGQVAKDGKMVNLKDVPEGYINVLSGLGKSTPGHLIISPIKVNEMVLGVIEIASFNSYGKDEEELIHRSCDALAIKLAK